jgi:hypothetical protein
MSTRRNKRRGVGGRIKQRVKKKEGRKGGGGRGATLRFANVGDKRDEGG